MPKQIVLTTTELIRVNCCISLWNKFCNSEQSSPSRFWDLNILKLVLENWSFKYGNT